MAFVRSLKLVVLSFLTLSLPSGNAFPILKQEPLTTDASCNPVSTYTTEWFLAHTLPEYRRELHNTALFYTRGTSRVARDLAEAHPNQYTTIWEVWPCYLYDDIQVESNPLRCIHRDHEERRTFYENMSRAFARMARKKATVMHSKRDYDVVPQDGIWARVELPTIQQATDVDMLLKINDDVSVSWAYVVTRDAWDTVKVLVQRAMSEVRAIFREAKLRNEDGSSAACSIWGAVGEFYLDSLW